MLVVAEKEVFSGGKTGKLVESPDDEVIEGRAASNNTAPSSSTAAIHPAHSRRLRTGVIGAAAGLFSVSSIWNLPSAMSCSRCAGSLRRHLAMSDRTAAGV